ncbi:putative pre-rRNA-processing protein esf2 [Camellia sinensis]|uniref:putative pre-rRNA-processing protein esf2 n=1 Tax=Camellia sinensis TaxID=4442 RepID=UPI0010364934|nr:putative pre-rRNA-processing protein esf2 [Camellia sinensis]
MDIQECFEDDEGTTSKKRKRGPRNLNAIDRGKRKVFEDDDDEVELIEGGEEEEEEKEEFDEVTMVDDDEDDIDLGDDED